MSATITIAQLRSTRNKHTNLINVAKCAGWAKRDGAEMLFLPECLGFMGDSAEHTFNEADPPIAELMKRQQKNAEKNLQANSFRKLVADTVAAHALKPDNDNNDKAGDYTNISEDYDPITSIIEELCFIANESNLWISGGGVHTTVPPSPDQQLDNDTTRTTTTTFANKDDHNNKKIYNTHVIIDNQGQIQSYYHKIHLFDVCIPNKVNLRESNTTSPGNKLVVCKNTPVGNLGLTICYDMRFPEMYVDLVQNMGAQVLLMPSAFTVPTGKAHWHALLQARAIESQCYVLAAAQVGQHNEKRKSYGHSVAYDPWGELMADAGGYDGTGTSGILDNSQSNCSPVCVPSIITADIDLEKLESVRERMPVQQHRDNSSFSC